jgi:hypothetical protein
MPQFSTTKFGPVTELLCNPIFRCMIEPLEESAALRDALGDQGSPIIPIISGSTGSPPCPPMPASRRAALHILKSSGLF